MGVIVLTGRTGSPAVAPGNATVAAADSPRPAGGGDVAERDKDLLRVSLVRFELIAAIDICRDWTSITNELAFLDDLHAIHATKLVRDEADSVANVLQGRLVEERKQFLSDHKVSTKDWGVEFIKRYPEQELIGEEIDVVVRKACRRHANDIQLVMSKKTDDIRQQLNDAADKDPVLNAKMAARGPQINENRFNEFRLEYFRTHAPKIVKVIMGEVRKLPAIQSLGKKVTGS